MNKTYKTLIIAYYCTMLIVVLVLGIGTYLSKQNMLPTINPQTLGGQIFQYVTIGYTMLSVAGGLYAFKLICKHLIKIEDEEIRLKKYTLWGIARLLLIGSGILLALSAFYFLNHYQSMIWCAAIAAIGLIFCKPNERKIELDLLNE